MPIVWSLNCKLSPKGRISKVALRGMQLQEIMSEGHEEQWKLLMVWDMVWEPLFHFSAKFEGVVTPHVRTGIDWAMKTSVRTRIGRCKFKPHLRNNTPFLHQRLWPSLSVLLSLSQSLFQLIRLPLLPAMPYLPTLNVRAPRLEVWIFFTSHIASLSSSTNCMHWYPQQLL